MSHELRTPVAGVIGFLQTTLDHWDALSEAERRDTVARAAVNARRLQTLTRDVLDVSGAEQGTIRYAFGPVDLREEVAAAVTVLRDAQPEREVTIEGTASDVWVNADGDRIMQVMLNLLNNAVASSPVGTPVNVTLDRRDEEVVVSVIDRGAGLSEDDREAVFEKFVRGRTTGVRGTGLGLYLCREIITAHNGRIWAEQDRAPAPRSASRCPRSPRPSTPPTPPSRSQSSTEERSDEVEWPSERQRAGHRWGTGAQPPETSTSQAPATALRRARMLVLRTNVAPAASAAAIITGSS